LTITLSPARAARHEALYIELARFTAQITGLAERRPDAPVPEAARAIAEDLLFNAQAFFATGRRTRALPEPASDLGGLVTQLGRALSQLDAWETANSAWNTDLKCFAWLLREPLPVRRLRRENAAIVKTARQEREAERNRRNVYRLINAKVEEAYQRGFAAGSISPQKEAATG
jgi:hypothetical protein